MGHRATQHFILCGISLKCVQIPQSDPSMFDISVPLLHWTLQTVEVWQVKGIFILRKLAAEGSWTMQQYSGLFTVHPFERASRDVVLLFRVRVCVINNPPKSTLPAGFIMFNPPCNQP